MFNKKIVPDFSPRRAVKTNTVTYSVPVQETHIPEKILISESEKIPLVSFAVAPPPVQSHTASKRIAFMIPQMAPSDPPLPQDPISGPTLAPAASFSPSLETFPATNSSYFKLSSDAGADASRWSLFPAISTINVNGYSIENIDNSIALSTITSTLTVTSGAIKLIDTLSTNVLEAIGGDLFFNTELLAKAGDIQNVADWSLYPALSTINVNLNNLSNVSTINGVVYPPPGTATSQWATFPAVSTVNMGNNQIGGNGSYLQFSTNAVTVEAPASFLQTDKIAALGSNMGTVGQYLTSDGSKIQWATPVASGVTSLNAQTGTVAITSAGSSVTITNPTPGTINLETATIGAPSWANYPAVNNVSIPDHDLTLTSANTGVSYRNATLDANVTIGNPALSIGLLPNFSALVANFNIGSVTQPTTSVNVTALGNVNILGGAGVSIAGGGGVSVSGVGGVAVTGAGAVSVQGGGISVNGGAVSLVGTSALSVAAGGVVVNGGGVAINGGGVAVNAGALTIASGTIDVGTIAAAGGGVNVFGSDIIMTPVGPATATLKTNLIAGYTPGGLAITDVATINGAAYPPTGSGVTSLNTLSGALTLAAGTGIGIGTVGSVITVSATGSGTVDLNGLLNKINAFPALPYTTASSSQPVNNQVPTAIVPDGSFPVNVPTVGAVPGGWGFSKANGSAATFNWYQYNPRFGAPAAPLPYIKSKIQSAWVLIRPTVNLYLAGLLAINLYSFDDANPPTSGFYNTRWAYSNSVGAVAGATGTNLFAGYTYLLYANDAPRIINSSAIGVPDSQVAGLRDPYDIYTDVNHIPLQNCVVAFNPWTNGTNYQTWTPTGVYPVTATVVFAGFGTNYNGLFFVVTSVPVVGVAPMVNGVVSVGWALISPQPSSFADQPIGGITVTQTTASGQAVGYVVLDIGFSYGPSTTSTTVSQHIALIPN